jgi:CHAT domain-containing protein
MSLWKVDDEATKILMTQFYANLMLGKSKRQSLLGAQRYLREYKDITTNCNPYDSPQFWGAFILLDALD